MRTTGTTSEGFFFSLPVSDGAQQTPTQFCAPHCLKSRPRARRKTTRHARSSPWQRRARHSGTGSPAAGANSFLHQCGPGPGGKGPRGGGRRISRGKFSKGKMFGVGVCFSLFCLLFFGLLFGDPGEKHPKTGTGRTAPIGVLRPQKVFFRFN